MGKEYTQFGDGWLVREEGSTEDWQPVGQDDVPADVIAFQREEMPRRQESVASGIYPFDERPEFAKIIKPGE